MSKSSLTSVIDREYISDLNRLYFTADIDECIKTVSTNVISAYITGSFVHYTKETIKHLVEFHLGWCVKRTLHGCTVCIIGSVITPEIYTRILAYDIKIYTELETVKLLLSPCKRVNSGKFLKYIHKSDDLNILPKSPKKSENNGLWYKKFTPINLYDIAGHQDELFEFYNFIKTSSIHKPIIIIHTSDCGVYKAIELCLLALNYELMFMDNFNPKPEFKKQKNSKFNRVPAYTGEKISTTQLQSLCTLHKFLIIFVKCKCQLKREKTPEIDTTTAELQQPIWLGKINCKKFIFLPPPPLALAYRIQDILTELNRSVETKDIELLLRHCKSNGIMNLESALAKLMFALADSPFSCESNKLESNKLERNSSEEKNSSGEKIKWYIDNHLREKLASSEGLFDITLRLESLEDTFESFLGKLYNSECSITALSDKLSELMWFYNIFTQLLVQGQEVPIDCLMILSGTTSSNTPYYNTSNYTNNFFS